MEGGTAAFRDPEMHFVRGNREVLNRHAEASGVEGRPAPAFPGGNRERMNVGFIRHPTSLHSVSSIFRARF